jgi:hypothetical protein
MTQFRIEKNLLSKDYILDSVKSKRLKDYHYHEKFDHTKDYETDIFLWDYGHGKRMYQLCLLRFVAVNERYVVAEELIPEDEMKKLREFCRCDYHTSYFGGLRYDPKQVGCLHTDFMTQSVIDRTKIYIQKYVA